MLVSSDTNMNAEWRTCCTSEVQQEMSFIILLIFKFEKRIDTTLWLGQRTDLLQKQSRISVSFLLLVMRGIVFHFLFCPLHALFWRWKLLVFKTHVYICICVCVFLVYENSWLKLLCVNNISKRNWKFFLRIRFCVVRWIFFAYPKNLEHCDTLTYNYWLFQNGHV